MDKEVLLKNLIYKASRDNSGDSIHKLVKKKTDNFNDLSCLSSLLERIIKENLFVGCREYIRLCDIAEKEKCTLAVQLNNISKVLEKKAVEYLFESEDYMDFDKKSEAFLALFAIGNQSECMRFLSRVNKPSEYIYFFQEMFFQEQFYSNHLFDIVLFLLNITKCLPDYEASRCVRVFRLSPQNFRELFEIKYSEICTLSKYYYTNKMFISLSGLMRMFEKRILKNNYYISTVEHKRNVYKYIGVDKNEFLDFCLASKTARALDFYCIAKYGDEFLELQEINTILSINNSQAVYCIVMQCLRDIMRKGEMATSVKKILLDIKEGIKNKNLLYDSLDEFEDKGMSIGQLEEYVAKCFHILCFNKQDVKEYLSLVSYFNVFSNGNLDIDYDLYRGDRLKYTDWENEYAYICNRYSMNHEIAYIVMNSYLRFVVSPFELAFLGETYLSEYWFAGYLNNYGDIELIQKKYNKSFRKERYSIKILDKKKYVKDTPEETFDIRFKIKKIDVENSIITVSDVETIASQFKIVLSNTVYYLLINGKIKVAYLYLKKNIKKNIYEWNRYASIGKNLPKDKVLIDIFNGSEEKYNNELFYIYMNSYIKTRISLNDIKKILQSDCYYLANLYYKDNIDYMNSEYYYIRPNYYSDGKEIYRVKKEKIDEVLNLFLLKQLDYLKENCKSARYSDSLSSIRVCFYANWEDNTKDYVYDMKLFCCESAVINLNCAIYLLHHKIYKSGRNGISKRILINYIKEYTNYYSQNILKDEDVIECLTVYLRLLHEDIEAIRYKKRSLSKWIYFDNNYNKNNTFIILNGILFDKLLVEKLNNTMCFSKIKEIKEFKMILDDLKNFDLMRDCIYEKTVYRFMYSSYQEFENDIVNSVTV